MDLPAKCFSFVFQISLQENDNHKFGDREMRFYSISTIYFVHIFFIDHVPFKMWQQFSKATVATAKVLFAITMYFGTHRHLASNLVHPLQKISVKYANFIIQKYWKITAKMKCFSTKKNYSS